MKGIKVTVIGLLLLSALFVTGFTLANNKLRPTGAMDSQQNNMQNNNQNTNSNSKNRNKRNKNTNNNSSNTEQNMNADPTPTP